MSTVGLAVQCQPLTVVPVVSTWWDSASMKCRDTAAADHSCPSHCSRRNPVPASLAGTMSVSAAFTRPMSFSSMAAAISAVARCAVIGGRSVATSGSGVSGTGVLRFGAGGSAGVVGSGVSGASAAVSRASAKAGTLVTATATRSADTRRPALITAPSSSTDSASRSPSAASSSAVSPSGVRATRKDIRSPPAASSAAVAYPIGVVRPCSVNSFTRRSSGGTRTAPGGTVSAPAEVRPGTS